MNGGNKMNSINKWTRIFFVSVLMAIFLGGVAMSPLVAAASENEDEEMDLSLKQFMKERKSELALLSQLNISASAGFSGHTAGDENLYQLGLGLAVAKDMYPGEFRFRVNTSLVIQNSLLQEHVTLLGMSYEHYLTPWLETYGFVERFSNTFLRLRYRYEIGGGFKAEFNVLPNKWQKKRNASQFIMEKYKKYIAYLDKKAELEHDKQKENEILFLEKQLEDLKNQDKGVMMMAKKKRSLLTLGLAVSVFSELEKMDYVDELMNLGLDPVLDNPLEKERQHFRLSIRPSFVFRPSRMITVKGQYYYKHPLFGKDHSEDPLHYRTDTSLSAALNLSEGASWTKSVTLIFEYKRHYDNNPFGLKDQPFRTGTLMLNNNAVNIVPDIIEDTHDEFMIKLNVEF
jgi:hypothetical protein